MDPFLVNGILSQGMSNDDGSVDRHDLRVESKVNGTTYSGSEGV